VAEHGAAGKQRPRDCAILPWSTGNRSFSKLLIVASGSYGQELGSLGGWIRTTVIRPADTDKAVRVSLNQSCDVMEIPIEWEERQTCRVLC